MGRRRISIKIHGDMLRHFIALKGGPGEVATKIGATRQSVHTWCKTDNIPPRQLANLATAINLSGEDIRALYRKEHTNPEIFKELDKLRMENRKLRMALAVFSAEPMERAEEIIKGVE